MKDTIKVLVLTTLLVMMLFTGHTMAGSIFNNSDDCNQVFVDTNGRSLLRSHGCTIVFGADNTVVRYLHAKRHNTFGPAYIHPNGIKEWSINGKLHRYDGPAVVLPNDTAYWYINGIELTESEFNARF